MNSKTKQKIDNYRSEARSSAEKLKQMLKTAKPDSPEFRSLRFDVERELFDKYVDEDFESEGKLPENDIDVTVDIDRLLGIETDEDDLEHWTEEYGKAGTGIENS